jgi:hypothetical protein
MEKYDRQLSDVIARLFEFAAGLVADTIGDPNSGLGEGAGHRDGNGRSRAETVVVLLGDHSREGYEGLGLGVDGLSVLRSKGSVVYLLDWKVRKQKGRGSTASLTPFQLTLRHSSNTPLCVVPWSMRGSSALQVQQLHSHDFVGEMKCDPTKRCREGFGAVIDLTTARITSNEMRLLMRVEATTTAGSVSASDVSSLPYVSLKPCEGVLGEQSLELSSVSLPRQSSRQSNNLGSGVEPSREMLEELISHLVSRDSHLSHLCHLSSIVCLLLSDLSRFGPWRVGSDGIRRVPISSARLSTLS